ncbi:serine/threonine-protein kinase [Nonomuraea gerenzanensis]|uniref:Serine/threonine protein kinase n=1 Tax=Nonomuraea gerenzanensis TaxID=93944 RepID=A0A1M4DZ61_9ACTN|nr:hypothetical protein [Nonomuraea gerenzanensis]UBU14148.1 hypothetical protein LCN96_03690 [Nonomuraea gerenzanensis]SBO91837.1 serine/threonine protein kinase [Nonomuraea gerenzanensis]
MEFQGWSDGLALRPRDYLGKGQTLAAAVRAAGPLRDEALHLFALGSATTMARLHLGGIAGLRLSPGNVMIGPRGQVVFAPGPRDSVFPAHDVADWAGVVVFAATGREPDQGADLDRLLPALRAVIEECRRSDAASRPSAVDLVRILLGQGAHGATVHELLLEAERRTRPEEPAPYAEHVVPTPFWRKPAYLTGVAIGIALVAGAAGAVLMISDRGSAAERSASDVVGAVGRRTATFRQVFAETSSGRAVAEGRLSFDPGAPATSYEMKVACGNDPQRTSVSLVGSRGVAGGVVFDADHPPVESCVQRTAGTVRELSSPRTLKGLIDAAGSGVTSAPAAGNGRTYTGSAPAHRVRGEEGRTTYAGLPAEGPVRFTLQVDGRGLPVRLLLRLESRGGVSQTVETVYRDWRPFEAIKGETSNG